MFTLYTKGRESDSYNIAHKIFLTMSEEINFHAPSRRYLTEHDFELLVRYYSSWIRPSNVPYLGYCFAQRLKNLVSCITEQDGAVPTVLDCGCGLGTESLACALLGAKVVGIDLNDERIAVAKKRLDYFKEQVSIDLDVDFLCKDILKYKPEEKFDVVYAREFISHVWSLQAFFKFARNVLKESGSLIITDANLFNPYVALKAYLDHRTALFTNVCDPETGEKVLYARERLFSPYYIARLLAQNGFRPESINIFGYTPMVSRYFVDVVRRLEKKVTWIPVGAVYEIKGIKL